jgi:hypothetical protein
MIMNNQGRCEEPIGLKKPMSVPAPSGVGPLVKARPEGDPGWPGAGPVAGAMVVGVVPV